MDLEGQIPPCHGGIYESKFHYSRSNLGRSARAKETIKTKDLGDTRFGRTGDDANSRSDPTFTRASPGLRS